MYKKAFTILEILLVMALISILLVISIGFINPNRQLAQVRNSQRQADVFAIYTAINQYRNTNSGNLPTGINAEIKSICKPNCTANTSKIDISEELNSFIAFGSVPTDPQQAEDSDITGYTVYVSPQGRVIVSAPLAENGATINTLE